MKMRNKVISLLIAAVMAFNGLGFVMNEAFDVIWTSVARAEETEIQAVFSLPFSDLGEEKEYGDWRYACRQTDGYAVITGYAGASGSTLTIPRYIEGIAVVGIGDNALAEAEMDAVVVHGNIMYIAENAFGSQKPLIQALTGSYGLYYAVQNGFDYDIPTDYELVIDVIDYTDSVQGSIVRRGDQYVCLDKLEGMRLKVGSIFFFEDARGTDFFYRVVALSNEGDNVIAKVEIPEIAETFIEAHVHETYQFTAEDFIPAEGVNVVGGNVSSRAITTASDKDEIKVQLFSDQYSNLSNESSVEIDASGVIAAQTTYTVDIVNGEIVYMATEEQFSVSLDLQLAAKKSYWDHELMKPKNYHTDRKSLGKMNFYCSYLSLTIDVDAGFEVSGGVTTRIAGSAFQRKVYDFDTQQWNVVKDNGNLSRNKDGVSIVGEVEGKLFVEFEASIQVFELVSVLEFKVEVGVKLGVNALLDFDQNTAPCAEIELAGYIEMSLHVGVWHESTDEERLKEEVISIGAKVKVFSKKWDHHDLTGLPPFKLHVALTQLPHWADECPYDGRCEVTFDTRTSQLIDPVKVFAGDTVPYRLEYKLASSEAYGDFLGWADSPQALEPNWDFGKDGDVVSESMTLYAVWSRAQRVSFDSCGGSSVPDQYVPAGGYAVAPEQPVLDGQMFAYWYTIDENGYVDPWDFEEDTIPAGGVTLYARWSNGDIVTGGTSDVMIIGDINSVNLSDYSDTQSGESCFFYDFVTDPSTNDVIGVNITGLRGSPVNLVVPAELWVKIGISPDGLELFSWKKVLGLNHGAFKERSSLKSVVFDTDIGVDTRSLFAGCTSLEYVDLSKTHMTSVQSYAFQNCYELKCVKLPAGISSIDDYGFVSCKALPKVRLLEGVRNIGNSAFYDCDSVRDMILPDGVKSIGANAFSHCGALQELYIPDSVSMISEEGISVISGDYALRKINIGGIEEIKSGVFEIGANDQDNLEEIRIRGSVRRIGSHAFAKGVNWANFSYTSGTAQAKLIIEDGVQSIGNYAFYNCTVLTEVTLADSVTQIGDYAFARCSRVLSFDMGRSVESIGNFAFSYCQRLQGANLSPSVRTIGDSAFEYCSSIPTMILPKGVEHIGQYAFIRCTSLQELYIPDTVRTISAEGRSIIEGDYALKKITIGGVEEIKKGVFEVGVNNQDHLEEIRIRGSVERIGSHAFAKGVNWPNYSYTSKEAQTKLIIEDGVESIGDYAFYNCTALTDVVLADSVTEIGNNAFDYCTRIVSFDMGESIERIGDYAFSYCEQMRGINISPTVRSIGSNAFERCYNITRMILPEGVESIGSRAFERCSALKELYIPDSVRTISEPGISIIGSDYALEKLTIGGIEEITRGMFTIGWDAQDNLKEVRILGSVKRIGTYAFRNRTYEINDSYTSTTSQTKLIIEEGVEKIDSYAFSYCTAFTEVSLPDSLMDIGDYAFDHCSRIVSVDMGEGVQTVGNYAFYYCEQIQKIDLSPRVLTIGDHAFERCQNIPEFILPEGLESIGVGAFNGCSNMQELYIPDSVKTISSGSSSIISGCYALRKLNIGGIETIRRGMFEISGYDEVALEELRIRGSVRYIDDYAFQNRQYEISFGYRSNTTQAKLIIEEGVEHIGSCAFGGCTAFTEAVLPDSIKTMGNHVFYYCERLQNVKMGSGVESMGGDMFLFGRKVTVYLEEPNSVVEDHLAETGDICFIGEAPCFILTLNANGGLFGSGETEYAQQVLWQAELPESKAVFNGNKIFSGWFADAACTQKWTAGDMPARDLTLYAGWDVDVYSVRLYPMGGTMPCAAQLRAQAGTKPVESIVPEREGCYFTGWYLDPAWTQAFDGVMPGSDLTLYAGWAAVSDNADYRFENGKAILTRYRLTGAERTQVYLPETVEGMPLTSIDNHAFRGEGITELYLPASLKDMAEFALADMDKLESICVNKNNTSFRSEDGVLFDHSGAILIRYPAQKGVKYAVPAGVETIAAHAFENSGLQNVMLNEGLRRIEEAAFAGAQIVQADLPDSLEYIGYKAFYECNRLERVFGGAALESIGGYAFENGQTALMLYGPEAESALRVYAEENGHLFNYYILTLNYGTRTAKQLIQAGMVFDLPTNPQVGDNHVFTGWYLDEGCTSAWQMDMAMPAKSLVLYAGRLPVFSYELMVNETGEQSIRLIQHMADADTAIVPETIDGITVTQIAAGCFAEGMTRIVIGKSVQVIEAGAISPAAGLILICSDGSTAKEYAIANGISVNLPMRTIAFETKGGALLDEVEKAEGEAFQLPVPVRSGCSFTGWYIDSVCSVAVELNEDGLYMPGGQDTVLYAGWTVVDESTANPGFEWRQENGTIIVTGAVDGVEEILIPDTLHGMPITAIEGRAFSNHASIRSVTIPGTITEIPEYAFSNCRNLEQVILADGIGVIGREAFYGCGLLKEIELPATVLRVENGAFAESGLTALEMGDQMMFIAADALEGCDALRAINTAEGNEYYFSRDGVLYDKIESSIVKYPAAKEGERYDVLAGTYVIGENAFRGALGLKEIGLPDTIWSVGRSAFAGCTGLEKLPELTNPYLTEISEECFMGCSSLSEISIPGNIVKIGEKAFAACTGLAKVYIPESVKTVEMMAFAAGSIEISGVMNSEAHRYAVANGIMFYDPSVSVRLESIALDCSSLNMKMGERYQLKAEMMPAGAETAIQWYSDDESVVAVDGNGVLHGMSGGSTTVHAISGNGLRASCSVHVSAEMGIGKIVLNSSMMRLEPGESFQLSFEIMPSGAEAEQVLWMSSDEKVALVDANGLVTAVTDGTAEIYVTADGVSASCSVEVGMIVWDVSIIRPNLTISIGEDIQLSVEKEPEELSEDMLIWSVDNESVADIGSNGIVKFKRAGYAVVTVQVKGTEIRDSLVLECAAQKRLEMPALLTEIGDEGFVGCAAEEVVLSNAVKRIGARAFANSNQLYKIMIPPSVIEIADDAFVDCEYLLALVEPDSLAHEWCERNGMRYILTTNPYAINIPNKGGD